MKELWKKIDRFMLKYGGYSLLIATVATVGFFAVLQWANHYVEEKTGKLEIEVAADGTLSVDYNYDDKEKVYILWETDGGHIAADNSSGEFKEQEQQKDTALGYFSYSHSSETAVWGPEDADGNRYETATVRAVLYEKDADNIYNLENYVTEVNVTLTYKDGKIEKAEDRLFSNPIREGSDGNWSQIYCIEETEEAITYRYRTGQQIDEEEILILCWQSENNILSETDYANGLYPFCKTVEDNRNKNILKAATTITCEKGLIEKGEKISAGLITEKVYKSTEIKEGDRLYAVHLEIE